MPPYSPPYGGFAGPWGRRLPPPGYSAPIAPSSAPQAAPVASGGLSGLSSLFSTDPGGAPARTAFFAALGGNSPMSQGLQEAAKLQQVNALRGETAKYLLGKGLADNPEEAMTLAGNDTLMKMVLKQHGLDDNPTYGKTPIYGTDPETGKTVIGTIGNDGTFHKLDTPGFDISSGVEKVDLGTSWGLYDKRTGQFIGNAPKDVAGEAAAAASGKGEGEAAVAYRSTKSKLPGLTKVVGQLRTLADQATYTGAGQALDFGMKELGMEPRDAAVARSKYIATVNNQILPLLRDTFGPQFTQVEGERLLATMGDPDLSPKQKQAVLESFIEQKKRDIEALGEQAGIPPSAPANTIPNAGGGATKVIGGNTYYQHSDGNWYDGPE